MDIILGIGLIAVLPILGARLRRQISELRMYLNTSRPRGDVQLRSTASISTGTPHPANRGSRSEKPCLPDGTVRATSWSGRMDVDVDRRSRTWSSGHGSGSYDPSSRTVSGPSHTTGSYSGDGRIYNSAGSEIGRIDHETGRVYSSSSGNEIGSVGDTSDRDASSAAAFRLLDNLNC